MSSRSVASCGYQETTIRCHRQGPRHPRVGDRFGLFVPTRGPRPSPSPSWGFIEDLSTCLPISSRFGMKSRLHMAADEALSG